MMRVHTVAFHSAHIFLVVVLLSYIHGVVAGDDLLLAGSFDNTGRNVNL